MENTTTTPMMAQWEACKAKTKDALLFFRLGDFYEAFYDDATRMAKELGLTLTARQGTPMCGVPFHTAEGYIDKLVAKGYKVAVAEQVEDPKAVKGLVKREIVRVVSPGTLVNSGLLSDKKNNYFASLAQIGSIYGLAALDVSTGEFRSVETEKMSDLLDELHRLRPSEILVSSKFKQMHKTFFSELSHGFSFVLSEQEEWRFEGKSANALLTAHFQTHSLDAFGLKGQLASICAAGALVSYLKQELNIRLDHVASISSEPLQNYMALDRSTMKNLELVESLLPLIDRTATPMGGRLLAHWIKQPLLSIPEIERRQEAISEFLDKRGSCKTPPPRKIDDFDVDSKDRLAGPVGSDEIIPRREAESERMQWAAKGRFSCGGEFCNWLKVVPLEEIRDLERLMMRIASRYGSPRDLLGLGISLSKILAVKQALEPFNAPEIGKHRDLLTDPVSELILSSLSSSPPLRIGEGDLFQDGYHPELDRLRTLSRDSISWMHNYQIQLREETGIKTLKVSYTKAFGYYIEVSRAQGDKIPPGFQRRQTLVNAERFITEELKTFEHQVLTAEERSKALETQLFEELREKIALHAAEVYRTAKAIAHLDVLISLALVAKDYRWTKPLVDDSNLFKIKEGRHPVVEQAIGKSSFISNDTFLNQERQLMLITGPNMAGKSTYIRQVALIAILAQIGSYVPATAAHIGLIDKIFSRIGASDDLARGQSTFMVEMTETANILNNATSRSLVLLDEIGRGTSTYDGISIAWAVAEYLLTTIGKQAKTLFATHYWELTKLEQEIKGAINYQVAVQETPDGIVFLRKIIPGGTDKSYGIHVAKLAGIPFKAIKRAEEMLRELETQKPKKKVKDTEQLSLLEIPNPLVEELQKLDVDRLTPLEALIHLNELKKKSCPSIQKR